MEEKKYVIARAYRAGIWAGNIESRNGTEVVLTNARRIWYWDGAASLSQLATTGTSKPENCKFPAPVKKVEILDVCEIIDVEPAAEKSIREVPVWKK